MPSEIDSVLANQIDVMNWLKKHRHWNCTENDGRKVGDVLSAIYALMKEKQASESTSKQSCKWELIDGVLFRGCSNESYHLTPGLEIPHFCDKCGKEIEPPTESNGELK